MKSAGGVVMVDRLDTLPAVVRTVAAGHRCVPGLSDIESMFSPEELTLMRLVRRGASDRAIGDAIGYSWLHAQRQVHSLFAGLGGGSRHEVSLVLGAL